VSAYYNENDAKAAAWLRELIKAGLIAPGDVDERSITDVSPNDVKSYTQCHFFAGIGGWSYAFRLAGVSDDTPAWTGSCPCQPFANQGKQRGFSDERDLWPAWFKLIKARKPFIVFGEQVERAIKFGWLDRLCADMDSEDYAIGSAVLGAHSVGAPQRRQRLYWVANAESERGCWRGKMEAPNSKEPGRSGAYLRLGSWPDHAGSRSTLSVPDVLLPSYGVPHRVAKLHGFGNAIVPQAAAEFIKAAFEALAEVSEQKSTYEH